MSLSRKRKKELRKLQDQAATLWESQQVLLGQAGNVAREAGRQLGNYNREQVVPTVQHTYEQYAAPYVEQGLATSKKVYNQAVLPTAAGVIGSALSVWDAANEKRKQLAAGRGFGSVDIAALQKNADKYGKKVTKQFAVPVAPAKKGVSAGGVIAIILGVAAAAGVIYAAWQTLRADDELWVADDPLRAPDA
ncbi:MULTISPECIES: DNA helicase [unclassified Microbacterium]|uniref:DNA helicase n=1 Tax=unclassified Microbacterium TaxID=2609290 RepID=UPI00301736CD